MDVTPSRSAPQPFWKTATTAPKVAAMLSRKPRVAFSGTTMLRKTSSSSTKASPTTTTRYGSSASWSVWEMSMPTAVAPVT